MGTDSRSRILIVDNSVAVTGALKAIVNTSFYLTKEFKFIFILPENSLALSYLSELGLKVEILSFVEISKRPTDLLRYLPYLLLNGIKLKNLAAKYQAQIIHVNDFYNLAGVVAKLLGAKVKLITHVRFLPQKFTPILAKFWVHLNLRFADQIICVSEAVKKFFPRASKVRVVPDPLPEKEIYPPKSIHVSSQEKEVRLLYLSNYIRGKGQEHALVAFKNAFDRNNKLRLTFAGGDMGLKKNYLFKQELEQATSEYGLEEVVKFEPFVQDIEKAIKNADILLNFSESESFSLTCLDALFYGTPLIASDCGGPAELFESNKSGLLVPNKDVKAMTQAIIELAGNLNLQQKFAENGKLFVRNKFSAKNSYLKLQDIYIACNNE